MKRMKSGIRSVEIIFDKNGTENNINHNIQRQQQQQQQKKLDIRKQIDVYKSNPNSVVFDSFDVEVNHIQYTHTDTDTQTHSYSVSKW